MESDGESNFQLLQEADLKRLNKVDLLAYTLDLQKLNVSTLNNIIPKIESLQKTLDEVMFVNCALASRVSISEHVTEELQKKIKKLESQSYQDNQYTRRDCIEIAGIPDSVSQTDLEYIAIKILSLLEINVVPNDVQACHRLKSGSTIVKFVNRQLKTVDKSSLGFINFIFINENLCPYYRFLWNLKLKLVKLIHAFWTFNG